MSTTTENEKLSSAGRQAAAPQPLAKVHCPLQPQQVVAKAKEASKRGRLPGFEEGGDGGLFSVVAFATPLDRRLAVVAEPLADGTRLRFDLKLRPLLPLVFIIVAITTIWPGVWITESMLESYFPGSWIAKYTWWWYIPLSALPLPWAGWSMWRRSSADAIASANEAITQIAKEVGGVIQQQ